MMPKELKELALEKIKSIPVEAVSLLLEVITKKNLHIKQVLMLSVTV